MSKTSSGSVRLALSDLDSDVISSVGPYPSAPLGATARRLTAVSLFYT